MLFSEDRFVFETGHLSEGFGGGEKSQNKSDLVSEFESMRLQERQKELGGLTKTVAKQLKKFLLPYLDQKQFPVEMIAEICEWPIMQNYLANRLEDGYDFVGTDKAGLLIWQKFGKEKKEFMPLMNEEVTILKPLLNGQKNLTLLELFQSPVVYQEVKSDVVDNLVELDEAELKILLTPVLFDGDFDLLEQSSVLEEPEFKNLLIDIRERHEASVVEREPSYSLSLVEDNGVFKLVSLDGDSITYDLTKLFAEYKQALFEASEILAGDDKNSFDEKILIATAGADEKLLDEKAIYAIMDIFGETNPRILMAWNRKYYRHVLDSKDQLSQLLEAHPAFVSKHKDLLSEVAKCEAMILNSLGNQKVIYKAVDDLSSKMMNREEYASGPEQEIYEFVSRIHDDLMQMQ